MRLEMARLSKGFITLSTLEGSFSSVGQNVGLEMAVLLE